MKTLRKKILLTLAVGTFIAGGIAAPTISIAKQVTVDAAMQTRRAISLTKNFDMAFGDLDYEAIHSGQVQLGTDGTAALSVAAVGLTLAGTPAAGDVDVSGNNTSTIEISCDAGGTLTDGGGNSLTLQNVEIAIDTGVAFGAGTACAGVGTVSTTVDLSLNNTPKILMGGEIDTGVSAITSDATYSTANAAGSPVTLRVVYQ